MKSDYKREYILWSSLFKNKLMHEFGKETPSLSVSSCVLKVAGLGRPGRFLIHSGVFTRGVYDFYSGNLQKL